MIEWLQIDKNIIGWLVGASILIFLVFLIVVPLLVVRIPSGYFAHRRFRRKLWADHHLVLRTVLRIGRNILGWVFLVVGIVMLVLPGQAIIIILAGIILLDFPGKYRFVQWIVARPQVLGALNWLRRRAGRPPLYVQG